MVTNSSEALLPITTRAKEGCEKTEKTPKVFKHGGFNSRRGQEKVQWSTQLTLLYRAESKI